MMRAWRYLMFLYHREMHDYYVKQSVMVPQGHDIGMHLTYVSECFNNGVRAMRVARILGIDYKIWS